MGLKINIEFDGDKQVSRTLAIQTKAIKDLRPAWDDLEKILNQFQKGVFLGKGKAASKSWFGVNPSGDLEAWQPLKDSTIKGKRGKYASYPLIRTQKLMKAFTQNNAEGAIRVKDRLAFVWGIDDNEIPYAVYHHRGGSRLPKRPVLRLPNNLRDIVAKVIQRYLAKSGQLLRTSIGSIFR